MKYKDLSVSGFGDVTPYHKPATREGVWLRYLLDKKPVREFTGIT